MAFLQYIGPAMHNPFKDLQMFRCQQKFAKNFPG